jgi:putative ABC transport system permease protein
MANILRDARIGLRLLWKHPGFTSVAVLTLALGIAANTAIFSVIYATFFEPLPYRDAERLAMVWAKVEGGRDMVSPGDFLEWKRQASVFESLEAWTGGSANLATDGRPEHVGVGPSTPGFLAMLGYGHPLALGRTFIQDEGTVGNERVLVLSHRLWRERFGADPAIIGRSIRLDGEAHTVVGVLAPGPGDENQNELWVPLALTPTQQTDHERGWLLVMGRLKPGVTFEQANANLEGVGRRLAAAHPTTNRGRGVSVEPFRNNFLSDDTKRGLWLLLGAVAFVLLIACANVANLLLARGSARQRELAVRVSLGASRLELVRQLLTESVVLAFVGGVLGVALAAALLAVVVALMPPYMLPTEANVRLNVPVLLFTLAACGLSGVLAGLAPAWQAARANVHDTLKEGGRSVGTAGHRLRRVLVAGEFAAALTLLAGGGLAIQSLFTLVNTDIGFRAERLLTFSLPVTQDKFANAEEIRAFYRQFLGTVEREPGVVSASVSTGIPLWGMFVLPFEVAGAPPTDLAQRRHARFTMVTPDYFDTLGIRIVQGRALNAQDREGSIRVAVVNETLARQLLPGIDPLTQRLIVVPPLPGTPRSPAVEWQIVGVSADIRSSGPKEEGRAEIHVPFWQNPWPNARVAVRTAGDPSAVHQRLAAVVQSMDPNLPLADVKTMQQRVSESLASDRFNTVLFGSFAAVALLLAGFGIYGVMSFVVAQRTHEIGLRMALGADSGKVVRQVLRDGMGTAAAGTLVGSIGAYFVDRTMRGVLFGVGDLDPTAFIAVAATLLGAALLACIVPARRAASVDPMVALRQD